MTLIDRLLVEALCNSFNCRAPVLEIGSHQLNPGGDPNHDLRPFFGGKSYVGSDISSGPGVDVIQDATGLSIKDQSIGTMIMVSTIEHIFGVFDVMKEITRVLSTNGVLLMTSHMDCGIHAYPSDYWRFTPEAFSRLLDAFPAKLVGFQGLSYNPFVVFAIGFKESEPDFAERREQFRFRLEYSMRGWAKTRPLKEKFKRYRRLASWRVFGSKDAYRKLRDENVIGWHYIPV